ncbi:MAG TPA: GNAT family N-acetyltransferase [Bryobacteraceae bacterium]|nr:GNAT family N-acetyltransferase [Bryobacteraceae bacterium]
MAATENEQASSLKISLRPATAGDDEFLLHIYASTRHDEMASWGWDLAQQTGFLRMQFDVRHRGYLAAYPAAETSVVSAGGIPCGSLIVSRGRGEIRLVDIALLSEFRGRGIGAHLLGMLLAEAARSQASLRLSVLRSNPAVHLYERLGFIATGGDEMYAEMEWTSRPSQAEGISEHLSGERTHAGKSE